MISEMKENFNNNKNNSINNKYKAMSRSTLFNRYSGKISVR